MKNTGKILGLIGVMTLLFSFSAISQEQRTSHDKVEYIEVGIHQKLKTNRVDKNVKLKAIKCKVNPEYVLPRINAAKRKKQTFQESFRKPIRYKK